MKTAYTDIIAKAGPPLWFDENGVPRYTEFHPDRCVMMGAQEAILAEMRCQSCGTPLLVALTWQDKDRYIYGHALPPLDRLTKVGGNNLHYGDPPRTGCCDHGGSMTTEFHRIVQAWIRTAGPGHPWMQLDQEAIEAIGAKSEIGVFV